MKWTYIDYFTAFIFIALTAVMVKFTIDHINTVSEKQETCVCEPQRETENRHENVISYGEYETEDQVAEVIRQYPSSSKMIVRSGSGITVMIAPQRNH